MAKINNPPPQTPLWPWGSPRALRDRLVDPSQLDRKKKAGKKGDAKNPALASFELLDFIGPAHSAEELRLPLPPRPNGHDADLAGFSDRSNLQATAERSDPELHQALERGLAKVTAAPERLQRLKALLSREAEMLTLVAQLSGEIGEIQRKMREEQKERGF